jgi:predicted nucleic-acid-binding protein
MIGIDSNILLRAIANDDPEQSPKARKFLSSLTPDDPGVLNPIVLAEVAWTLRVRYKRPRAEIVARFEALLCSASYVIAAREAVSRALQRCKDHELEISDALIGELNLIEGARHTVTFDIAASATPAFERLL